MGHLKLAPETQAHLLKSLSATICLPTDQEGATVVDAHDPGAAPEFDQSKGSSTPEAAEFRSDKPLKTKKLSLLKLLLFGLGSFFVLALVFFCAWIWPQLAQIYFPSKYEKELAAAEPVWTCFFLLPQWLGDYGDSERFIDKTASAIPGAKGEELYAQLTWSRWLEEDYASLNLNAEQWKRCKAGFARIFADFPHDMTSRIVFIYMAIRYHDEASIEHIFDGFST